MGSQNRTEDIEMSVEDMDEELVPAIDLTTLGHACCGVCSQPATGHCPRCRNMWYCSEACMQANRRFHLALCRSFAELPDRPNPQNRSYFRGIYFPSQETFPRFVWLEYFGNKCFTPNPAQLIPLLDGKCGFYTKFDCHRELRRSLGYQIETLYGLQPDKNKALQALLPDSANNWDGCFVMRGFNSVNGAPGDLDTNAVPAILAFLAWMSSHHSQYPGKLYALETVMGDEFDPPDQQ